MKKHMATQSYRLLKVAGGVRYELGSLLIQKSQDWEKPLWCWGPQYGGVFAGETDAMICWLRTTKNARLASDRDSEPTQGVPCPDQ